MSKWTLPSAAATDAKDHDRVLRARGSSDHREHGATRSASALLATSAPVHELALMEDLIAAVEEETRGPPATRVHVVRLLVGRETCVSPDALRFCFDVCARGTALEGAALEIVPGAGDELRLQDLEVT
jgi:hypothetical protein